MKTILQIALLLASLSTAWANPSFTLDNPNISGVPGQSVGWGFSLIPDALNWISVTGSFLSGQSNPSLGVYQDLIGAQGGPVDFVLAPGSSTWSQAFDLLNGTGAGFYALDPFASIGAVNSGQLTILYEVYSDNPNTCVNCFVSSDSLSTNFSITVNDVPEPSTFLTMGLGGVMVWLARRRRSTR